MGVWYAVRHRAPRAGAAIAVAGGAVALVAVLVVVPHFAPTDSSAFESRYDDPSLDGRDLSYLAALLLPLALLPLGRSARRARGRARAGVERALERP